MDTKTEIFIEYFSNGKKEAEIEFLNGLKEGTKTEWFENGNKEAKTIFKNGVINGISIEWYLNGQKKSSCETEICKVEARTHFKKRTCPTQG